MYGCVRLLDDEGTPIENTIVEISRLPDYWEGPGGVKYDPMTGYSQFGYAQLILTTISHTEQGVKEKNER